jgi:hypothetical protein
VAGPGQIVRVDLEQVAGDQLAGKAPRGVVINSAGSRAFVFNFISRSITAVDITKATAPTIVETARASAIPGLNTTDATVHLGAELFYSERGPDGRTSRRPSCCYCSR